MTTLISIQGDKKREGITVFFYNRHRHNFGHTLLNINKRTF